jgi:hypothetical protein
MDPNFTGPVQIAYRRLDEATAATQPWKGTHALFLAGGKLARATEEQLTALLAHH